jgi:hypothetical protein
MKNSLSDEKYDVQLVLSVHGSDQVLYMGTTHYFSDRLIRFVLDAPDRLKPGMDTNLLVAIPQEVTAGHEIFVRAHVEIANLESVSGSKGLNSAYTARVKRFDFVTKESLEQREPSRLTHAMHC